MPPNPATDTAAQEGPMTKSALLDPDDDGSDPRALAARVRRGLGYTDHEPEPRPEPRGGTGDWLSEHNDRSDDPRVLADRVHARRAHRPDLPPRPR